MELLGKYTDSDYYHFFFFLISRLEKDHEIRILQKSWGDEQDRLNRELQKMQRKVDDLPRSIESATRSLRSECDR